MRIAIISDIHGNQIGLEAVLQDLQRQPAIDQQIIKQRLTGFLSADREE